QQLAVLDELERLAEQPKAEVLGPDGVLRDDLTTEIDRQARIRALRAILAKLEDGNSAADGAPADDITLSALFTRYLAERKPSAKVAREFDLIQRHFITVNGDVAVSTITKSHVRSLKSALLTMPSSKPRRGQQDGATLSTNTVTKLLALLRSVLAWGT